MRNTTALAALDIPGITTQVKNFLEAKRTYNSEKLILGSATCFPQEIDSIFSAINRLMHCFAARTDCARRKLAGSVNSSNRSVKLGGTQLMAALDSMRTLESVSRKKCAQNICMESRIENL